MATVWTVLAQFVCLQLISGAVVNVALRKPVNVSSRYDNRDPAIAVNGNTIAVDTCCVMTTAVNQNTAWWWVDLQTQVQDATVKIYFRTDYKKRRNGVMLYTSTTPFSNYPSGELCHNVTGSTEGTDILDVVSVNCTGTWTYLMVYTQTDNDGDGAVLDFGEVQVLGCDDTYGVDCNKSCDSRQCAQNPALCDRYTGACPAGGCKAGWMGSDCTQACLSGSYGSGCNLSCEDRNCILSSTCNHVTGQCVAGCLSGWTGTDCKQACPSGSYGSGCNSSCGDRNCRNSSPCDHVTGQCVGGCLSGWNGTDCKQECTRETNYGANCSKSCSARQCRTLPTSCDPETGQCPDGCQDGWTEKDCTNTCPSGTYGPGCGSICGNCAGDDICNHTNGNCPGDCKAGWQGVQCTNSCPSGTYGPGCGSICGNCAGDDICNHTNGNCPGDCKAGWQGVQCTNSCPSGTYGPGCGSICGNCAGDDICNHTNGNCPGDCKAGWQGVQCTNSCPSGTYGPGCGSICGNCADDDICNHTNGNCPGDCKAGWQGVQCTNSCPNGTYGPGCGSICGNCAGDDICNHTNGNCPGDCKAGWQGVQCTNSCPSGTYGPGCGSICGNCTGDDICNHTNGNCPGDCKAGWQGVQCTNSCHSGTYGPGCVSVCGNCTGDDICNHTNGNCPGDCKAGWQGVQCTNSCVKSYGVNCKNPCGQCIGDCNPVHGQCPGECQEGYSGTHCQMKSPVIDPPNILIPAVVGVLVGLLVVVVIIVVFIVCRRRRSSSSKTYKDANKHSQAAPDGGNVYANVNVLEEESTETEKPPIHEKQPVDMKPAVHAKSPVQEKPPIREKPKLAPLPKQRQSETDTEEEIPDEVDQSSNRDYYNDSAVVIHDIPVAELEATVLKIKCSKGGFEAEYNRLPTGFTAPYSDSQKPENAGKNKFRGYYPYDHNRVRLSSISDIPGSDYINASLMHSYDQKKTYIAAQAPNKKTVGDFWRMIWEHRCGRVIMLTGLVEAAKVKCYQYWPDREPLETDQFQVDVEKSDVRANYTVRHLKVTSREKGDSRIIVQYHYTSWPDHGVPDTLALVNFIWMMRRTDAQTGEPLLVHCSAGIGRTGTYIAVDSLLDQARAEGIVDVLGYVSVMRGQRKNMIQTKEQYECVFQCLTEMTKYGDTSMDSDNFSSSFSSRGMDSIVDRKTLREITQMTIKEKRNDSPAKHQMWVDGNQNFIVRVGPSLRHIRGYLQAVTPTSGVVSLLWKLVEERNVHNVFAITPLQVEVAGDKGSKKKYGDASVTSTSQTSLTPDLTMATLQLRMNDDENSQDINLFKSSRSPTLDILSSSLLDHAHLQQLSADKSPVVLIHGEPDRKCAVMFCIMSNILSGIMEDSRVDVIGHARAFLKCCPDLAFTEKDLEMLFQFAQKCVEKIGSSNTYANL